MLLKSETNLAEDVRAASKSQADQYKRVLETQLYQMVAAAKTIEIKRKKLQNSVKEMINRGINDLTLPMGESVSISKSKQT